METADIAVTGEFCPKKGHDSENIDNTACSSAHMLALIDTKAYSALASNVIEYVLTNSVLKETERLYYLVADLHANYMRAKCGTRTSTLPGNIWAKKLNISEEYIFVLQKSLEDKGYFEVCRNKIGNQNEINIIKPTVPASVFEVLSVQEERLHARENNNPSKCRRSYLDDKHLFVKFNNKQIESLVQTRELSPLQKIIWILLYMRSQFAYVAHGTWVTPVTQQELSAQLKCARSTISNALNKLEEFGYIKRNLHKAARENVASNRKSKNVWFIEALFPVNSINALLQQKTRSFVDTEYSADKLLVDKPFIIAPINSDVSLRSGEVHPRSGECSQSLVFSNKYKTTKSIKIKNNNTDVFFKKAKEKSYEQLQRDEIIQTPTDITLSALEEFDIEAAKHKLNMQKLSIHQRAKAINFAKKLFSSRECKGDIADISQDNLIRHFIEHAANFKMTKISCKTRDEEVDAALSVAYRAVVLGTWRCPPKWGQAIDLNARLRGLQYEPDEYPPVTRFKREVKQFLDS